MINFSNQVGINRSGVFSEVIDILDQALEISRVTHCRLINYHLFVSTELELIQVLSNNLHCCLWIRISYVICI